MAEPPRFASTPADVALMDQALAEADADCLALVGHLRGKGGDPARATAELVQGLLNDPRWDRLELASTLGAAISMLATVADSASAALPSPEDDPHDRPHPAVSHTAPRTSSRPRAGEVDTPTAAVGADCHV